MLYGQFGFTELMIIWDNILLQGMLNPQGMLEHLDYCCLAMLIYLRDITLNKESSIHIIQIYEKFPTVTGAYLRELINLSWMIRDLYE
jgi:hypothetical protein